MPPVSVLASSLYRSSFRINALYKNNRMVVWSVAALLALEFGVNVWLLTYGTSKGNQN